MFEQSYSFKIVCRSSTSNQILLHDEYKQTYKKYWGCDARWRTSSVVVDHCVRGDSLTRYHFQIISWLKSDVQTLVLFTTAY